MNQKLFTTVEVVILGGLVVFVMYLGGAFKLDVEPTATPAITATSSPAGPTPLFTQRPTRTPTPIIPTPTPPPLTTPSGLIAFETRRDGNSEIYVMKPDGSEQTNLTQNSGEDYAPLWSPDGKRIAFLSTRTGWLELHVMNADGTGVAQVSRTFGRNLAYQAPFIWSPDGNWILAIGYRVWPGSHSPGFAALDLLEIGSAKTITIYEQQSQYSFWMPSWSPDGKYIALNVQGERDCLLYIGQIVNQRLDLQPTNEYCSLVSWLADSNRLLFSNGAAIFTIKPDGSDKQRLGEYYSYNTSQFFLSPHNQLLIVTMPVVNSGQFIRVLQADGSRLRDLSNKVIVNYDSPISWSPDEQWIVYHSSSAEKSFTYDRADIFVVNIYDSANPARLTDTGNNFSPQWQP